MFLSGTASMLLFVALLCIVSVANALSNQCINESYEVGYTIEVYNATQDLRKATSSFIPHSGSVDILKKEWPNPLPEGCHLKDGDKTLVCVFDYTSYVSELVQACQSVGGKVFQDEYTHVCENERNGRSTEVTYLNYTMCVGNSCDPSNLKDDFEERLENFIDGTEGEVGYNCQVLHEA